MIDEYTTIKEKTIFEFKEKGSKFIGIAFPVKNMEEVEDILHKTGKEFYDATHCCYAFRLGTNGNIFRYSDAGEPTGTAGKPILGVIDHHKLTDILIIVVRYFGGKKLGVSGLFNAYFSCAENVLKNATPLLKIITETLYFTIEHNQTNLIMKSVGLFNARIGHQEFGERAAFSIQIRKSKFEEYREYLINITNGKIVFNEN